MPVCVAQLTDCHLGADWDRDPADALEEVIDAVIAAAGDGLVAVVVTGDIAHAGSEEEYARAGASLRRLPVPVHALPGNHDDRARLARQFALPDTGRADLSHAVALGPLRLVALDTQRPGQDGGQFDAPRAEWLAATLAEDRVTPTLLAMHHPPLPTGIPVMDGIGLPAAERAVLHEVLEGQPQVRAICAGHVHRTIAGTFAGIPVLTAPSTDAQLALDLAADEFRFTAEAPGFALHLLLDGAIVSHVGSLGG
jgi:Icc protein